MFCIVELGLGDTHNERLSVNHHLLYIAYEKKKNRFYNVSEEKERQKSGPRRVRVRFPIRRFKAFHIETKNAHSIYVIEQFKKSGGNFYELLATFSLYLRDQLSGISPSPSLLWLSFAGQTNGAHFLAVFALLPLLLEGV